MEWRGKDRSAPPSNPFLPVPLWDLVKAYTDKLPGEELAPLQDYLACTGASAISLDRSNLGIARQGALTQQHQLPMAVPQLCCVRG